LDGAPKAANPSSSLPFCASNLIDMKFNPALISIRWERGPEESAEIAAACV